MILNPFQSSVKRRSILVNRIIFKRVKNELGQRNQKINHFITGIVLTHLLLGVKSINCVLKYPCDQRRLSCLSLKVTCIDLGAKPTQFQRNFERHDINYWRPFFNFRGINFARNIFSITWIDAVDLCCGTGEFYPANYHKDQLWPRMTWNSNCWNCENCC